MNMFASIKDYLQKKVTFSTERPVVAAYDIWSDSYDAQPGNLMLDLDEVERQEKKQPAETCV